MKIAVAQLGPLAGDIPSNLNRHQGLLHEAVDAGAELVVFPELSLTGYEPTLANELAVEVDDSRFDALRAMSDASGVTIGVGAPTRCNAGVRISLLCFQPGGAVRTYSKVHLHHSETPFFVAGPPAANLIADGVALAICYELSVPAHAEQASLQRAKVYVASVADSEADIERVLGRLGEIARRYSMTVLMANHVGPCHRWTAAGRSSAWNRNGELLGQLDAEREGVLVVDTATEHIVARRVLNAGPSQIGEPPRQDRPLT